MQNISPYSLIYDGQPQDLWCQFLNTCSPQTHPGGQLHLRGITIPLTKFPKGRSYLGCF